MKLGISIALLRPLAELLAKIDEDPAAFLDGLGVTAALPANAYVAAERVDRALDAIARRRGDPGLALTLAQVAVARPLGLFGHMIWLSGTLGDALERAVKHYAMVTQRTTLRLERDGAAVRVRAVPVVKNLPRGRVLTEFPFASLALRARGATNGAAVPRAVRFTHAGKPSPIYAEVFRAPVTFGAAHDEIELAAAQLDLPLAGADPITSEVLEERIARLAVSPALPIVERVRQAAGTKLDASPDDIAKALGMSARTLRRQLDQSNTTFRGIVDELRRARADELIASGMAVKEVAFALGFSEPSAFSRAYKRWSGKAPRSVMAVRGKRAR
jgi:AraC-like DNA-binding protein